MTARHTVKFLFKKLFWVVALPLYGLYRILSVVGSRDGTFQAFSQLISLIPGKVGVYTRAAFYHLACPDTSDDISVGFMTVLSHADTTLSKGVYIGPQCNIGQCSIGRDTLIGSGVHILSGNQQHDFSQLDRPIKEQGGHFEKIRIEEDCWIGNGSIVMANVSAHSVIAAGSVAPKAIPPYSIAAGNPARILRRRDDEPAVTPDTPQTEHHDG